MIVYRGRRGLVALITFVCLIAAVLTVTTAWWVYPALWLAPLATLTAFFHLVRSFVEHAITDSETPAHSNRLLSVPPFLQFRSSFPTQFPTRGSPHITPLAALRTSGRCIAPVVIFFAQTIRPGTAPRTFPALLSVLSLRFLASLCEERHLYRQWLAEPKEA